MRNIMPNTDYQKYNETIKNYGNRSYAQPDLFTGVGRGLIQKL